MSASDPLDLFLPPVKRWFRSALGEPTPAQRQGWPSIAAGQNTLILAPTGSGKTLAAFLACLDGLWRQERLSPGVQVLYISPLKALNNDIHRNLQVPLEGVAREALEGGEKLAKIEAAVRTGDTPLAERRKLLRSPPHVLITTPESLHLLLTSRARDTLKNVTHCIVDEIHALCPNKRGVFLAILLERLQALNPREIVRVGLSATQRPLDEVARYLGVQAHGLQPVGFTPRPVTIVDAGVRRDLDLKVVSPVEHFGPLPEKSIWPSIYRLLGDEIRKHHSTIVFANNRRVVERITANLNETEDEQLCRAHHGSVALEVRQQTEQALKEGRLPAVVATASLELGIDMGAVDLVCQVESPGNVARGLQRVGRAGHVVGQKSKGRLIPKTTADLVEQAVLAREMAAGNVEEVHCPQNCLDVLAQQIVAAVAVESWDVPELYAVFRRAYPYRDLLPAAFDSVLEMVSGRYRFCTQAEDTPPAAAPPSSLSSLQPRISWDRTHNRLHALPGSQSLALVSGGAIPDTGHYAAYTGTVRIGELDEEFVHERRIGDVFLLGTNSWRVERIDADRVMVSPAEGVPAMAPFWRGETSGRSYDLGLAIGRFLRELAQRIDRTDCVNWLEQDYLLDPAAARNLRLFVRRQLVVADSLPTDRTITIEASRDPLGDWQVIVLNPLGGKFNMTLRLALENRLSQRLGYRPQILHHNDGLLIRFADTDEPILDLFEGLTAETIEAQILAELTESALFTLRFRQNAARALLLPRTQPGKRAPLWLQRLRGRDLLQVARQHPDFPIVAETVRECLHEHLDLAHLRQLLADIAAGTVKVVVRRADGPSPFASGMLLAFTMAFMYEFDHGVTDARSTALDKQALDQLIAPSQSGHLLDPRAIQQVERRLRGVGQPPRTAVEMAEWLRRLGDVTADELEGPMAAFLEELTADHRALRIELPACRQPERWVLTEEAETYRQAFILDSESGPVEPTTRQAAGQTILHRFLATHALVGLRDVLDRYPFDPTWAARQLEQWAKTGRVVAVPSPSDSAPSTQHPALFSLPANLEQVERGSLSILRREVVSCPAPQFVDFLLRWQHVHPDSRRGSAEGLAEVLDRLQGFPLPAELWESVVLPARVPGYQPRWLDERMNSGEWAWVRQGEPDGSLAFWRREEFARLPAPALPDSLSANAGRVLDQLRQRGASFVVDLAQDTGATPSAVRAALRELAGAGVVANDHFDVIRRGDNGETAEPVPQRATAARPTMSSLMRQRPGTSARRRGTAPEGRWSLVRWGQPDAEEHAVFRAELLLERYGIVARELAMLDPGMPPWRVLYEVLSRLEMSGAVRRGYFVEGLSGAQFALPEAVQALQDAALPAPSAAPVVLLHSLDPANLYGSGAPLDIPLLDGGTRPLLRRAGNWLVLRAGRPVLIIEQQGKRLTALASASREDIAAAVARLPEVLTGDRQRAGRHKLSVAEWNGQAVTGTSGRELLEAAGFVRDYQEMTLYAGWQ